MYTYDMARLRRMICQVIGASSVQHYRSSICPSMGCARFKKNSWNIIKKFHLLPHLVSTSMRATCMFIFIPLYPTIVNQCEDNYKCPYRCIYSYYFSFLSGCYMWIQPQFFKPVWAERELISHPSQIYLINSNTI